MGSTTRTDEEHHATLLKVAIGEALFASTLATAILTNQVATGRMSHDEVSTMLDGATLVLERHRGAHSDNVDAVDYARSRLTALGNLLDRIWRSRPRPATCRDAAEP